MLENLPAKSDDELLAIQLEAEYQADERRHAQNFTIYEVTLNERLKAIEGPHKKLAEGLVKLALQFAQEEKLFIREWIDPVQHADKLLDQDFKKLLLLVEFFSDKRALFSQSKIPNFRIDDIYDFDLDVQKAVKENKFPDYSSKAMTILLLGFLFSVEPEEITFLNNGGTKSAYLLPERVGKLRVVRLVTTQLYPHSRKVNSAGSEANMISAIRQVAGDTMTTQCFDLPFLWGDIAEYTLRYDVINRKAREMYLDEIGVENSDYEIFRAEIAEAMLNNPASSHEGGVVFRTNSQGEEEAYWVEYDLSHPGYCRFGAYWDIEDILEICEEATQNIKPLTLRLAKKFCA